MGNKSYGLAWDMDTQLAWAKLRTTVGWDDLVIIPVTIMTSGTPNFHVHMVILQGVAPVAD